ncbi:hypothetical protein BDZ91DRAFT_850924 [Kalaharituber pfeilii]|nr:hypothetical protein BDZ91DRAFT_850924 [Kalaharituber pfeilii]
MSRRSTALFPARNSSRSSGRTSSNLLKSRSHQTASGLNAASAKQRAYFASLRNPFSVQYSTRIAGHTRYEQTYGPDARSTGSRTRPLSPAPVQRVERGRLLSGRKERRPQRRSSRSVSPDRRVYRNLFDEDIDMNRDYGQHEESEYNRRFKTMRNHIQDDSDSDDDWDDIEFAVSDEDPQTSYTNSRLHREEVAYLRRMLQKFRFKKGERLAKLKKPVNSQTVQDSYISQFDRNLHSTSRPSITPSRATSTDAYGRGLAIRTSTDREGTRKRYDYPYSYSSTQRINHMHHGQNTSHPKSVRFATREDYHDHTSHRFIPRPAPITNKLKSAINSRTYPQRTYGRALHVKRWLSDRYSRPTKFLFGDIPKPEGIKRNYVIDPKDPNRFLNVPRPRPIVGRSDNYNGAAWNDYVRSRREWFEGNGLSYPDVWVKAKDGKDIIMTDAQANTTVKHPNEHAGTNNPITGGIDLESWRSKVAEDAESIITETSVYDVDCVRSVADSIAPYSANMDSITDQFAGTNLNSDLRNSKEVTVSRAENDNLIDIDSQPLLLASNAASIEPAQKRTSDQQVVATSSIICNSASFSSSTEALPSLDNSNASEPSTEAASINVSLIDSHICTTKQTTTLDVRVVAAETTTLRASPQKEPQTANRAPPAYTIPDAEWEAEWSEEWKYCF